MGRPLPGYRIALLDEEGRPEARRGRDLHLARGAPGRPDGRLRGRRQPERVRHAPRPLPHRRRRRRDEDGYITYVGRADDVFKSSDYRISPFELESALIEHDAVAEAAVVPKPEPGARPLPKAFIILKPGRRPAGSWRSRSSSSCAGGSRPTSGSAGSSSGPAEDGLGKIRRVELRSREQGLQAPSPRGTLEFWQEDFPELNRRRRRPWRPCRARRSVGLGASLRPNDPTARAGAGGRRPHGPTPA